MDGDEDDVVPAEETATFVDAAAALGQRDVFLFGNEEGGVVAEVGEGGDDAGCDESVPNFGGVFKRSFATGNIFFGSHNLFPLVYEKKNEQVDKIGMVVNY